MTLNVKSVIMDDGNKLKYIRVLAIDPVLVLLWPALQRTFTLANPNPINFPFWPKAAPHKVWPLD